MSLLPDAKSPGGEILALYLFVAHTGGAQHRTVTSLAFNNYGRVLPNKFPDLNPNFPVAFAKREYSQNGDFT